jgi:hypothetical protein
MPNRVPLLCAYEFFSHDIENSHSCANTPWQHQTWHVAFSALPTEAELPPAALVQVNLFQS